MIALKREWLAATSNHSDLLESAALPALTHALQAIGALRLFVLTCGEELAAGLIAAIHGDRLLAFFAAYDTRFDRASPGILLMTEVTKLAFDRGLGSVDY